MSKHQVHAVMSNMQATSPLLKAIPFKSLLTLHVPGRVASFFGSAFMHVGGCRNCGPFLGTLNIRCRNIIGIQKGTIILTTTHVEASRRLAWFGASNAQGFEFEVPTL